MMVLLTMNLYFGDVDVGFSDSEEVSGEEDVSAMSCFRMLWMMVLFQLSVEVWA